MSPRTGRPRADNPRTINRAMRLTADEDALLTAAAERDGKPIAEWMRSKLLAAAKRQR
jgi:uncharacterized protein (DUF1778 family)